MRIPVFEPQITDADIAAVTEALRRREVSGNSPLVAEFESAFASYCGRKHGIAVSSGTAALQLAVKALGIGAGDEVLVSASTNIATALACFHNGALPLPVDSERRTWNLDLGLLDALAGKRTKAIIPVHLFGHPVDMDAVMRFARERNLYVIEDAAEAHGAEVRGKPAGSFGDMACFSFYANKVISTGEGGMVVTDDEAWAEKLRSLRNLYFGEPRFYHERAGFNFRMPAYNAAMGVSQLRRIEETIERKRGLAAWYREELSQIAGLQSPAEEDWAKNIYWMYAMVVKPDFGTSRDELMRGLAEEGIETRTFFCPMNRQPFLRVMPGWRDAPCPVADELWETGMYLPSSLNLTRAQVREICDIIRQAKR